MSRFTLMLVLCALCISPTLYGGGSGEKPESWNLSRDVSRTGNQISFNQSSRRVWFFMESDSLLHDPFIYKFLSDYQAPCNGNPPTSVPINGVSCWQDPLHTLDHNPSILFNFTDTPQFPFGPPLAFPPRSLVMHPAPDRFAIVAWKSPFSGRVNIAGSFTHLNPCGNGVRWSVDKGSETLASGVIDRASERFGLARVRVAQSQVLYFILDPNGDYACDSTLLRVTILRVKSDASE